MLRVWRAHHSTRAIWRIAGSRVRRQAPLDADFSASRPGKQASPPSTHARCPDRVGVPARCASRGRRAPTLRGPDRLGRNMVVVPTRANHPAVAADWPVWCGGSRQTGETAHLNSKTLRWLGLGRCRQRHHQPKFVANVDRLSSGLAPRGLLPSRDQTVSDTAANSSALSARSSASHGWKRRSRKRQPMSSRTSSSA